MRGTMPRGLEDDDHGALYKCLQMLCRAKKRTFEVCPRVSSLDKQFHVSLLSWHWGSDATNRFHHEGTQDVIACMPACDADSVSIYAIRRNGV